MELDGDVRIQDQGRELKAGHATFQFDAQQQLEQVVAKGEVRVTERAAKREGTGTNLVYRVDKKTIVLEGTPAAVSDPRGTVEGSEIVFDLARDRVDVVGGTKSTYRPEGSND